MVADRRLDAGVFVRCLSSAYAGDVVPVTRIERQTVSDGKVVDGIVLAADVRPRSAVTPPPGPVPALAGAADGVGDDLLFTHPAGVGTLDRAKQFPDVDLVGFAAPSAPFVRFLVFTVLRVLG